MTIAVPPWDECSEKRFCFEWSPENFQPIFPGETLYMYVEGGIQPYQWILSGADSDYFELTEVATWSQTNELRADTDAKDMTVDVSVMDSCGNVVIGTILCCGREADDPAIVYPDDRYIYVQYGVYAFMWDAKNNTYVDVPKDVSGTMVGTGNHLATDYDYFRYTLATDTSEPLYNLLTYVCDPPMENLRSSYLYKNWRDSADPDGDCYKCNYPLDLSYPGWAEPQPGSMVDTGTVDDTFGEMGAFVGLSDWLTENKTGSADCAQSGYPVDHVCEARALLFNYNVTPQIAAYDPTIPTNQHFWDVEYYLGPCYFSPINCNYAEGLEYAHLEYGVGSKMSILSPYWMGGTKVYQPIDGSQNLIRRIQRHCVVSAPIVEDGTTFEDTGYAYAEYYVTSIIPYYDFSMREKILRTENWSVFLWMGSHWENIPLRSTVAIGQLGTENYENGLDTWSQERNVRSNTLRAAAHIDLIGYYWHKNATDSYQSGYGSHNSDTKYPVLHCTYAQGYENLLGQAVVDPDHKYASCSIKIGSYSKRWAQIKDITDPPEVSVVAGCEYVEGGFGDEKVIESNNVIFEGAVKSVAEWHLMLRHDQGQHAADTLTLKSYQWDGIIP